MKKRRIGHYILGLVMLLVTVFGFQQNVSAVQDTGSASLTVIKLKNSQGTTDGHQTDPIAGSFYTLVKVGTETELSKETQKELEAKFADKTVAELEEAALDKEVYYSEATDENGVTSFSDIKPGIYYGFEVDQKTGKERLTSSEAFVVLAIAGENLKVYPKTKEEPQPETTIYKVRKVWEGKKLDSVTVHLLADGKRVDSVVLNASNNWEFSFTNLAKVKADGKEIVYSVEEEVPANYTVTYAKMSDGMGMVITNTYIPPTPPRTRIIKTGTLGIYWLVGIALVLIGLGYRLYHSNEKK